MRFIRLWQHSCSQVEKAWKSTIQKSGTFLVVAGRMNEGWHFMSQTRLNHGTVLLAGGYSNNDQGTTLTWIYRP